MLPLFDGPARAAKPQSADTWRSLPIAAALGLNAGKIRKLSEVGISTLGDAPPSPPASQEVNLLDLFARLQRARERAKERARQLGVIEQQRKTLQAEAQELYEAIEELDKEELRVLAAAESDTEADQAEKVLAVLQGMLAGKEA